MSKMKALWLFLLLVPVFNLLTVWVLPTAINQLVLHRIVQKGLQEAAQPDASAVVLARKAEVLRHGAVNIALPAPRADASARTVVRPSPDLLYTACVFDLSDGPLHLQAPVPEGYLSISGFAADSSNFFAVNDQDAVVDAEGQRQLSLLLTLGEPMQAPAGTQVVVAPSVRGLVLFRTLIPNDAAAAALRVNYQARQRCTPLSELKA